MAETSVTAIELFDRVLEDEHLMESMGIENCSKDTVSKLVRELDAAA